MALKKIRERLGLIFLIPLFFIAIIISVIIYFIVIIIGIMIVDPFVWIITQRTFFLAFAQDKLWNKGELLGEKTYG